MKKQLLRTVCLFISLCLAGVQTALSSGAGHALSFNGQTQWIDINPYGVTPDSGFTMECWVKITGPNSGISDGYEMFVGDNDANYRLGVDNNYHPYVNFGDRTDREDAAFTFSLNTWYHYALVGKKNADTTLHADIYVNGHLIYSINSPNKSYATCNWLRIGNSEANHQLNGQVDEVRFWNTSRTTQQIRENMHMTVDGSSAGLVGYWPLDEGTGTTAADLSSSGKNGLIHSTPSWVTSTAVLGSGSSASQTITTTGYFSFPGTSLDMQYTSLDTSAFIVVTFIDADPGAITYTGLNNVYHGLWLVETYSVSGSITLPSPGRSNHPNSVIASIANFFIGLTDNSISTNDASAPHNLKLFTRGNTSDGSWVVVDSAASISANTVQYNTMTIFTNQFAIGSTGNSPLPIQLSSFAGTAADNGVKLQWSTLSETNNYGYYVERRSAVSTLFTTVSSFIPGAGTSHETHDYTWTDQVPAAGDYYYRLRQIDMTGEITYSEAIRMNTGVLGVKASTGAPQEYKLSDNYPNPFNPSTTIQYQLPSPGAVRMVVYNSVGQEVAKLVDGQKEAGYYSATWNAGIVASGTYFVRVTIANETGKQVYDGLKKLMLVK